jgi:hypothetical protein
MEIHMSDIPQGSGWWQASDGKFYPPQPAPFAAAVPAPTSPPSQKKTGFGKKLVVGTGGLFVAVVAISAMSGAGSPPKETALNAASDSATTAAPAPEEVTAGPTAAAPTPAPTDAPKPEPTTTAAPPTTQRPTTTTEAPKPQFSVSQLNAKRSAKSYLEMTPFSRTGLIKQLEFEGYSNQDATFAADAVGADWNEQAARAAKAYLDMTAFSRSGLISQLQFEGYTPEQAAHGVSAVGL